MSIEKIITLVSMAGLSKSKYFDGVVPSIFDLMHHQYLSSCGHTGLVTTNKKI